MATEKSVQNLITYSIKTFQNSNLGDVQTNARKALEAFCKYLITFHFGEERGNRIIFSQDEEFNRVLKISPRQQKEKREFVLSMLVKVIFDYSDILKVRYLKNYTNSTLNKVVKAYKEYLLRYINVIIFNGNLSAHESAYVPLNNDDVIVVQKILSKLLYWLFDEFLEQEIPDELMPYIGKYDIFLSYRHTKKEWTETLRKNLINQGYKVFVDKFEIIGGENYKIRLKRAIDNSKVGVLILSSHYEDSEWIKKEFEWMQEKKSIDHSFRVIPIVIDKFSMFPEENIHYIDFTNKEYKEAFYELICSIEMKPARSIIDIDKTKIIIPKEEKESKKENEKIESENINPNILNILFESLNHTTPTIIFNKNSLDITKELEEFKNEIQNIFEDIYIISSPPPMHYVDSEYILKIKEEAGLLESRETQYIKNISAQCNFYQPVKTFRDWANILLETLDYKKQTVVVFNIDKDDKFYHLVCEELNRLWEFYSKNLKVIIITKNEPTKLQNIYINSKVKIL